MYSNKQHSDLMKSEICSSKISSNGTQPENRQGEIEADGTEVLQFETEVESNRTDTEEHKASSIASNHITSTAPLETTSEINPVLESCPTKSVKNTSQCKEKEKNCKIAENKDNVGVIVNGNGNDNVNDINCESFKNQYKGLVVDSINIIESQQRNLEILTTNDEFSNIKQQSPSSPSSSLSMSSVSDCCDKKLPSKAHQFSGSPVISIHSLSSIVVPSDSDSDLNSDTEGSHENYVIKKLGTQVTYTPNDPNMPNINNGHKVLNQKVIPNGNQVPLAPLATLAAIGDSIGAAQSLGPGPSLSGAPQRPQIASIAVNSSSDVTFGDKHFYEGPVTIQQFLIDSRDKRKETDNNKSHPTNPNENAEVSAYNLKDKNCSEEKSSKLYNFVLKRKKLVISVMLVFVALLITTLVLASSTVNDSKSKLLYGNNEESRIIVPINSSIDTNKPDAEDQICKGNGTLCLIDRDVWQAHPPRGSLDKQVLPLHRVVIAHTASEPCDSIAICSQRIRVIQEFHMFSNGWGDIGYNFLISSDGLVYVGRGWDIVGAHTKGYNFDSVGVTFIGTYNTINPTQVQLDACLSLLAEGVRLKKLIENYRLYGARQLLSTQSPGDLLYNEIKTWPHWSADIT